MNTPDKVTSADLSQMTHLTSADRFPAVTVDEIDLTLIYNINGGWPNRPDERTAMQRWKIYTRLDPAPCTYCLRLGDETSAVRYLARLIDNANMDEGYIETRCPSHPIDRDQTRVRRLPKREQRSNPLVPDTCMFPNLHDDRRLCGCPKE